MNSKELFQEIENLKKKLGELKSEKGFKNLLKKAFLKINRIAIIVATILIPTTILYAAQIIFVPGSVISADDVNSNFTELYDGYADLDDRVTAIESSHGSGSGISGYEKIATQCSNTRYCTAKCTAAKKVIGGGCYSSFGLVSTSPLNDNSGWTCEGFNGTSPTTIAWTICAQVE